MKNLGWNEVANYNCEHCDKRRICEELYDGRVICRSCKKEFYAALEVRQAESDLGN